MTPSTAGALIPAALISAALLIAAPAGAAAQEIQVGPSTYAVTVRHIDRHPGTPAAARRILVRLGDAALAACGAPDTSLSEVRQSVRRSACWRDSMAAAVAKIADPVLAETFARDQGPRG